MNSFKVGSAVAIGAFILMGGLLLMYMSANSNLKADVESLRLQLTKADDSILSLNTRSTTCEREVASKDVAVQEKDLAFEECKEESKKSEEEMLSWKKQFEAMQQSEASASAKLEGLHAQVDDLRADNEHLNSKITALEHCAEEKKAAEDGNTECMKKLETCETNTAAQDTPKVGGDDADDSFRNTSMEAGHVHANVNDNEESHESLNHDPMYP